MTQRNQLIGAIKISKNISCSARELGIHQPTAQKIWKKYQETGSVENRPRSGRPSIFSQPEKACIVGYAVAERRKPFRDIGNEVTPSVSERTVQRICSEEGYHRRVARKVPLLKPATKAKRLRWAREQTKNMSSADWDFIAWSDEAYICLDDKKG